MLLAGDCQSNCSSDGRDHLHVSDYRQIAEIGVKITGSAHSPYFGPQISGNSF